jgi:RNA polymerase sigma factor (sigma-70 family)
LRIPDAPGRLPEKKRRYGEASGVWRLAGAERETADGELIRRLKDGDRDSFTALVERHSGKLYRLAYRMCGSNEDAEDIVQQTFVLAYTNIGGFLAESSLYTWMYAIARNQCLKLLEKRKKDRFSSMETLIAAAHSDESADGFSASEKRCYIRQVREGCLLGLLRCLPFYQRMAFILNVLLRIRAKDVAAVIGKTENATRLLVHRARRNLKDFLCRNCSLYDPRNPCRCENLVHFSLKRGWIQTADGQTDARRADDELASVVKEIDGLKRITALYDTLEDPMDLDAILRSVRDEIGKRPYRIFSGQK